MPHTVHDTMYQWRGEFGEQLFCRFAAVNWPPRSCVKSLNYRDNLITIADLEENIKRVIGEILAEMLEESVLKLDYQSRPPKA